MPEIPRAQPTEYYNPRPLILGGCFFWGIAVGFCLFYFSPPAQLTALAPAAGTQALPAPGPLSELERRNQDVPVIAEVAASLGQAAPGVPAAPELETMNLDPPAALLTTDGGLTGKMARPLRPVPAGSVAAPAVTAGAPAAFSAPPPIPELLP